MKEIQQIYHNDFGVAFYWIKDNCVLTERIQVIFRETGFYLSEFQLQEFVAIMQSTCSDITCSGCCRKFLLKTPVQEIDLAVSVNELRQIKDLVEGALFHISLNHYLKDICKN
ncbi:hypothetical protein [Flavobacterium sp. MK4S-17]|uniref:hypothetical protein n=1 Tax=Flavobacterium sp. MK4S-17 TaxID=2543737 RepID=UPI00135C18CB|nr:hypothetical protein [Flavobacterium sp. MK4S-17]